MTRYPKPYRFRRLQVLTFQVFYLVMKFNWMATHWRVRRGIPRIDTSCGETSCTSCSKLPNRTCTHFDLFIPSWNFPSKPWEWQLLLNLLPFYIINELPAPVFHLWQWDHIIVFMKQLLSHYTHNFFAPTCCCLAQLPSSGHYKREYHRNIRNIRRSNSPALYIKLHSFFYPRYFSGNKNNWVLCHHQRTSCNCAPMYPQAPLVNEGHGEDVSLSCLPLSASMHA